MSTISLTRSPEKPAATAGARPRPAASKPARRASMLPCAAASLAMFLIGMDTFIVNVALPTIGTELHANMAAQQWIADGYTLAFAALLLLAGNLSDRFGAKRAFMAGTAGFAASSLIGALAASVLILQQGTGLDPLASGPVFLPSAVTCSLANMLSDRLSGFWSTRRILVAGIASVVFNTLRQVDGAVKGDNLPGRLSSATG